MEVGSVTSSDLIVDQDETGFNALTAEDFLEMLVVQLQNQDPTAPMSNEELLSQISQMRTLESNEELAEALERTTVTEQLSNAASFIGKRVTAGAEGVGEVDGVVERAFVSEGEVFLTVEGRDVSFADVNSILPAES